MGWRLKLIDKKSGKRLAILGLFLFTLIVWGAWTMIIMPGKSYRGELPPLTSTEIQLRDALQKDVMVLAEDIKYRNFQNYQGLTATVDFITEHFTQSGYEVKRQGYKINDQEYFNVEVEILGRDRPKEIVVVGGHYDSVYTSPAANDNGSGVAATLELAKRLANQPLSRTLRFVTFVNEEPPFFWTEDMGSLVYAKRCKERGENIVGMISLETMGYFDDTIGSQSYPVPFLNSFYPLQGNYIAFIGNLKSQNFLKKILGSFRRQTKFPSEGAALPGVVEGVGWSDHWSFWQQGYPAIMVTDTAPFRYPYYHTDEDTPDKINYDAFARVVMGLEKAILEFVNPG